jgi:hypothetical protein
MGLMPVNATLRTAAKAARVQVDFMFSPLDATNFDSKCYQRVAFSLLRFLRMPPLM